MLCWRCISVTPGSAVPRHTLSRLLALVYAVSSARVVLFTVSSPPVYFTHALRSISAVISSKKSSLTPLTWVRALPQPEFYQKWRKGTCAGRLLGKRSLGQDWGTRWVELYRDALSHWPLLRIQVLLDLLRSLKKWDSELFTCKGRKAFIHCYTLPLFRR